ncbi:short chain dehydrogenase family protein [Micavibrio aeruginosavorus ARL-13]|uniref:Short chain dehydrogenase family protein n=1 Tax=Micavibrio aeruginosavorus (strain ARL-13) TaxID=856793 RepID=G2KR36_MICAA|nr:short chain dehydrogenase family protein [Micavibrio aeruginosavorus ARL-13]
MTGRVAVITGASRGIGAAVARRLAAAGAHVVLVARTTGALEALDDEIRNAGGRATLIPLNLLDFDKVDTLGPALAERFGRCDILVANAGMLGTLGPLPHADAKEWDRVIGLNLTANFRLVRTLDPLLRASDAGRAIFVTSGAAEGPRAYWGAYAVSKAGLEAMARSYAAENEKTNLRVNIIDPGRVRTKMRAAAYPGEDPQSVIPPEDVVDAFLALADPAMTAHGQRVKAA